MNNPILNSETFDRAVGHFGGYSQQISSAISNLHDHTNNMRNVAQIFADAVDKLGRIEGMKAENEQRKHRGEAMAFVQADFDRL